MLSDLIQSCNNHTKRAFHFQYTDEKQLDRCSEICLNHTASIEGPGFKNRPVSGIKKRDNKC